MTKLNKIICGLLLMFPFLGTAQSLENWQVGVKAATFYFGRANSTALYEKGTQNFPNGYSFGLTLEKNWNPKWGFKTGLEYSNQNFKYITEAWGPPYPMVTEFEYFKTPLALQISIPVNDQKGLFLTFEQGFQVSFLTDYLVVIEGSSSRTIYSPGKHVSYRNGELMENRDVHWYFNKITFGLIGSAGFKKFLAENWSMSAKLLYEYDLTDADNGPLFRTDTPGWEAKSTHNYRIGIGLGVQYHFNFQKPYVEGIL